MSERVKRKLSATGSWGSSDQYHDLSPVTDDQRSEGKSVPPPRPPPPAANRDAAPTTVGKSSFFATLDWQDELEPRTGSPEPTVASEATVTGNGEDSTDVGMKRRQLDSFEDLVTERVGNKDEQDSVAADGVESHELIDGSDDDDEACLDGPPAEPVADLLNMGAFSADVNSATQQVNLLEMGGSEPSFYDQLIGAPDGKPPAPVTVSQNLLGDDFAMFQQVAPPAPAPAQVMNTFGGDATFGNFDAFQSSTPAAAASDASVNLGTTNTSNDLFRFMDTKPAGGTSSSSVNSLEKDLMSGWDVNHLSANNNIPRISSSQEIDSALGAVAGVSMPRNNSVPAGFSNTSQKTGATPQAKPDPFAAFGRFLKLSTRFINIFAQTSWHVVVDTR